MRTHPRLRTLLRRVVPSRRREDAQWRRIDAAVLDDVVADGPFAGMRLVRPTTGSQVPKRLGSYESELHGLIESWAAYDRVIDVGCGEGWYVVGLARRMAAARVMGFDISSEARSACRTMARINSVTVEVGGELAARDLDALIEGSTLVIVDIEGAELDLLDPAHAPTLAEADILVELHDFLRPGTTSELLRRFNDRDPQFIAQEPRDPEAHRALRGLSPTDSATALSESRPADQRWLWLPRADATGRPLRKHAPRPRDGR